MKQFFSLLNLQLAQRLRDLPVGFLRIFTFTCFILFGLSLCGRPFDSDEAGGFSVLPLPEDAG